MQKEFESYIFIASSIPSMVIVVIHAFVGNRFSVRARSVLSLAGIIVTFSGVIGDFDQLTCSEFPDSHINSLEVEALCDCVGGAGVAFLSFLHTHPFSLAQWSSFQRPPEILWICCRNFDQ